LVSEEWVCEGLATDRHRLTQMKTWEAWFPRRTGPISGRPNFRIGHITC
jgi:hypothetical protein